MLTGHRSIWVEWGISGMSSEAQARFINGLRWMAAPCLLGASEAGVQKTWMLTYGPIVDINLKIPPKPQGYAFIEFEDARDAEDVIRGRAGYNFDGHKLREEHGHGGRGQSSSFDRHISYSSGGAGRGGVSMCSDYRVLVTIYLLLRGKT